MCSCRLLSFFFYLLDTDNIKVEADGIDAEKTFYSIYKKQMLVFYLSNVIITSSSCE